MENKRSSKQNESHKVNNNQLKQKYFFMQKKSPGLLICLTVVRKVPKTPTTSKLKFFVILVNGLQPLTMSQRTPS